MSNPSFTNIDRWLFELMEGNLSPQQIEQLETFLMQHPELDIDRDMWELAKVEQPEVVFEHQEKFIRRKPVGLYMFAGFSSIAVFLIIGINLSFSELNTDNSTLSQNKLAVVKEEARNLTQVENSAFSNSSFNLKTSSNVTFNKRTNQNTGLFSEDQNFANNFNAPSGNVNPIDAQLNNFETNELIVSNENQPSEQLNSNTELLNSQIVEEKEDLKTHPVKNVDVNVSRNWHGAATASGSPRINSSDNSKSFSSQLNKASRALSRMLDNPVALKNLKDPNFLIPGMNQLDVNFGNTGTLPATKVQTLTRLQWPEKENQQLINQISVDGYNYAIRGGLGVQVNNAYYGGGQIMNSNMALTYSPKLSVNRNILIEPAIRLKMGNKLINSDKISGLGLSEMERGNVQEFYPTGTAPDGKQLWYRDLGLGMMVNTKWFFAGLQADNLFRHYDNIYSGDNAVNRRVGNHFIATIGTDYESKREQIGLSPYIVYQKSEKLNEAWFGVNSRFSWFTLGASVSSKMDYSASAGLKFTRFSLNYSVDYTKSEIWNKQFISHQLVLKFISFNFNNRQRLLNI